MTCLLLQWNFNGFCNNYKKLKTTNKLQRILYFVYKNHIFCHAHTARIKIMKFFDSTIWNACRAVSGFATVFHESMNIKCSRTPRNPDSHNITIQVVITYSLPQLEIQFTICTPPPERT